MDRGSRGRARRRLRRHRWQGLARLLRKGREDASRIRRDHGAENFSVMRRVAVNLLRQDETSKRKSIKGRRKQAGWDNDYLGRLLGF